MAVKFVSIFERETKKECGYLKGGERKDLPLIQEKHSTN
jgi:hypothetical protein